MIFLADPLLLDLAAGCWKSPADSAARLVLADALEERMPTTLAGPSWGSRTIADIVRCAKVRWGDDLGAYPGAGYYVSSLQMRRAAGRPWSRMTRERAELDLAIDLIRLLGLRKCRTCLGKGWCWRHQPDAWKFASNSGPAPVPCRNCCGRGIVSTENDLRNRKKVVIAQK